MEAAQQEWDELVEEGVAVPQAQQPAPHHARHRLAHLQAGDSQQHPQAGTWAAGPTPQAPQGPGPARCSSSCAVRILGLGDRQDAQSRWFEPMSSGSGRTLTDHSRLRGPVSALWSVRSRLHGNLPGIRCLRLRRWCVCLYTPRPLQQGSKLNNTFLYTKMKHQRENVKKENPF